MDSGAYSAITPFVAWRGNIHAMGAYRYDACHVDTHVAYTNNGYTGAFRGFGNTETTACIEQAMDELADRLGIDPIDLRLMNCLRPGDETAHGQRLGDDVGLVECLEHVRRVSDWDRKRREYGEENRSLAAQGGAAFPFRKGIGIACFFHGLSLGAEGDDFAVSTLQVNDDNSLTLTSGLTDYGTGSRTVYTLIAAEVLGLNPDRIHMLRPDTGTAIAGGPTVASRATVLGGNAVRVTAERLDSVLRNAAANLFGCSPAQVLRDGERYIGPQEEPVCFEDVARHARQMGLMLSAHGRWDAPKIHWSMEDGTGKPYFAYHYGAQVADVTVDVGTGKVSVTNLWASHNTGTVVFPQGILGQLYGGITQGIGYALMERVEFDQGYIQGTNFDAYLIPTALDVPEIEGHFVQKPFSPGRSGPRTSASRPWCRPRRPS